MNNRSYYASSLTLFLSEASTSIVGKLSQYHSQDLVQLQTNAWLAQIECLKEQLTDFAIEANGIFFEFGIPRMGKRADVVLVVHGLVFVLEFKVGASEYARHDKDQALDYALDLKHFHEGSHKACIVPVLVATEANSVENTFTVSDDGLAGLLCVNKEGIRALVEHCCSEFSAAEFLGVEPVADSMAWASSAYKHTPTIIQAAQALYQGHKVEEITHKEASGKNLRETAAAISAVIERSKANHEKAICFVTGVPGAGKTLAGLNITTNRMRAHDDEHAVFLSGNGPLVEVLREALARDEYDRGFKGTEVLKRFQGDGGLEIR